MSAAEYNTNFQERMRRINDPGNTYYVDHHSGLRVPKRIHDKTLSPRRSVHRLWIPFVMAVLIGALALMLARLLRVTLLNMVHSDMQTLSIDLMIAAVLGLIIGCVMIEMTGRRLLAQWCGVICMALAMHNLVWLFPTEFAAYYSPDFVDHVKSQTEPMTLYLPGQLFTI